MLRFVDALFYSSIAIWNVNGNNRLKSADGINNDNHLQEPIYTTGIAIGHSSKVVSIQPLVNNVDNFIHNSFEWKSPNDQVCKFQFLNSFFRVI